LLNLAHKNPRLVQLRLNTWVNFALKDNGRATKAEIVRAIFESEI